MGYFLRHGVWVLFQVFLEFVRVWHIPVYFRQNKHCISRVVLCLHRRFLACARACSLQFLLHSDLAKVVDCLSRHSGVSGSAPERLHIERDWKNENTVNWCLSKFSLVKVRWLKIKCKSPIRFLAGVFALSSWEDTLLPRTNDLEADCNGLKSHPGRLVLLRAALYDRDGK